MSVIRVRTMVMTLLLSLVTGTVTFCCAGYLLLLHISMGKQGHPSRGCLLLSTVTSLFQYYACEFAVPVAKVL